MKHKFLLSALTALIVFAATTTAEAGIFGRLSVVWNGCNPCEPVACMPCEAVACNPCDVVACNPCDVIACDPCGHGFAPRPFRPFGGFFLNAKARLASSCAPLSCDPCEPVASNPCDVVACDPCDPCGTGFAPRLPFNGFFRNLFATKAGCYTACDPCEAVACDPCAACW